MTRQADAHHRMVRTISRRVAALRLQLDGLHVLTEAATGPYAATPVVAAAAGATVTALARASRHGSVADVRAAVYDLGDAANVADRIRIVDTLGSDEISRADIVTNSGHLRPLDAAFIDCMKPGAAIPLMYESWELRPGEVDLAACRERGVRVAGTNECHPEIRVFDFLGMLAINGLLRLGVPVCHSRILLICDNPFAPFIARTLVACQAEVETFADAPITDEIRVTRRTPHEPGDYGAVVIAATPGLQPIIGRAGEAAYTPEQIGSFGAVVQVWGDVDRSVLPGVRCYPESAPRPGHMGILLSEIGSEPIVRLQAGGLKVGEVLVKQPARGDQAWDFCQTIETSK